MWKNSRTGAAALAALTIVSTGCENSTELETIVEFDAESALADYEAFDAALASDDWAGFLSLGDRTPFGASPAAASVFEGMTAPKQGDGGRAFALDLARRMTDARENAVTGNQDGPFLGPIISGWHRGTTFVYDPATDDYTPDLMREGAPDTGVRFILYELDESGVPIVGEENGHADLVDEGDGSVEDIVLRLTVVHLDAIVLDYRTSLDHDATTSSLNTTERSRRPTRRCRSCSNPSRDGACGRTPRSWSPPITARSSSTTATRVTRTTCSSNPFTYRF